MASRRRVNDAVVEYSMIFKQDDLGVWLQFPSLGALQSKDRCPVFSQFQHVIGVLAFVLCAKSGYSLILPCIFGLFSFSQSFESTNFRWTFLSLSMFGSYSSIIGAPFVRILGGCIKRLAS